MDTPTLDQIIAEEKALHFTAFDADTALEIGMRVRELGKSRGQAIACDIILAGQRLLYTTTNGLAAKTDGMVKRKGNLAMHFGQSSLRVRLTFEARGMSLADPWALDPAHYALKGGAFPILLKGTGAVGTITVGGLTDVEDHALAVEAIAAYLKSH